MKISKRLYKIAESVSFGSSVADIGTDHGYVPMLLIRDGKCPRVIMSDISGGSLARAKETFVKSGLSSGVSESDFRIGNGLETIEKGEVGEIIIAGLGGHTIAGILGADINKSKSFSRLILQPRKHSGTLRHFLFTRGWDIESEQLAEEGKFACEIICAVPSAESASASDALRDAPYPEDDIRWKYPEAVMHADPALASKRIEWKLGSIDEQISSLMADEEAHLELICRLRGDAAYLKELLTIC